MQIVCLILIGWANLAYAVSYLDNPAQYHVQTDERGERSFKFQTWSGQYRKEKRLNDGTVFGSYGWVDANGYLRLTDYIADAKGYRISKQHVEFVGLPTDPPTTVLDSIKPEESVDNLHYADPQNPGDTPLTSVPVPAITQSDEILQETYEGPHGQVSQVAHVNSADSAAKDGSDFKYHLGNQFQEEKTVEDGTRKGKYGYVDPFGILRVVNYKAGAQGFEIEKENYHLGLDYGRKI